MFARKKSLFSEFINNCILDVEIVLSKMINEFDFYQSLDSFYFRKVKLLRYRDSDES